MMRVSNPSVAYSPPCLPQLICPLLISYSDGITLLDNNIVSDSDLRLPSDPHQPLVHKPIRTVKWSFFAKFYFESKKMPRTGFNYYFSATLSQGKKKGDLLPYSVRSCCPSNVFSCSIPTNLFTLVYYRETFTATYRHTQCWWPTIKKVNLNSLIHFIPAAVHHLIVSHTKSPSPVLHYKGKYVRI